MRFFYSWVIFHCVYVPQLPYPIICQWTSRLLTCPVCVNLSVMSNSLWPHGLWPARLFCPWDSPGKNTRVGCHSLLQRNFPTQGSNPGHLHHRQFLYCLSYREVLFTCPSYCKYCCNEHWGTCVFFNFGFLRLYAWKWESWVIWWF